MVWDEFDQVLERLREALAATDPGLAPIEALGRAIFASNAHDPEQLPQLRLRMTLVAAVPALQAHATIRNVAWRRIVAEWSAERLGARHDDLLPQAVAHAALGTAIAAFTHWVRSPDDELGRCLDEAFAALAGGFPALR